MARRIDPRRWWPPMLATVLTIGIPAPAASAEPLPNETPLPRLEFSFTPEDQAEGSVRAWTWSGVMGSSEGSFDPERHRLSLATHAGGGAFGFWQSPVVRAVAGSEVAGPQELPNPWGDEALFRAQWIAGSDVAEAAMVPGVRFRATSFDHQQTHELSITSRGNARLAPSPGGRPYDQIFSLPAGSERFRLAFDVLNFDPTDAAEARVWLSQVMVQAHSRADFRPVERVLEFDFAGNAHGFLPRGGGPEMLIPSRSGSTPDGLSIRGTDTEARRTVFGFFGRLTDHRLLGHAAYRVTWTVTSNALAEEALRMPGFRLRANDGSMQLAALVQVCSFQPGARVPAGNVAETYELWFDAPWEVAGNRLSLCFDYLWEPSLGDDPKIVLRLRHLAVDVFTPPME